MLDRLGLDEIASCAGLSKSTVTYFVSHSHARNNRSVLFNFACAMIIHLIDMLLREDAELAEAVAALHRHASITSVSVDSEHSQSGSGYAQIRGVDDKRGTGLVGLTTGIVSEEVVSVGKLLCNGVLKRFLRSPNGTHFVQTVLMSCLLPTTGFHVLSRSGHSSMVEAFWFRHNEILHSSTHMKYQQLSLLYNFLRTITPTAVEQELHTGQPSRSVMKLLSFPGSSKIAVDRRGWTYAHMDEGLESMIVRSTKGLDISNLGYS